jgi:uncharacterized protein (TIGR00299 family) protein
MIQGLHLHLDCPSGVAGDMMLGALLDLGVPLAIVEATLARLPVRGYRITVEKTLRGGLAGTDLKVPIHGPAEDHAHAHDHDHAHEHSHGPIGHAHRHYREIREMLEAHLEPAVKKLALDMFGRLARAEAKLHGTSLDEVAFHEVGAIDSIVDVVGTAAALVWLAPTSVSATPVPLGHGTVTCAHGILPVPSPATLEIVKEAGVPVIDGGVAMELCTPTGAAIVASVVEHFGPMPAMTVSAVGYGAGDCELADRPNLLRAVVGHTTPAPAETLVRLEANLDDMNPELCEHVADRLFAAGALDVWWTPVTMKKSRPAFVLTVLASASRLDSIADLVLTETTTLGVRHDVVDRRVLDRRVDRVDTPYGNIAVKVGLLSGRVVNVAPEYESCRKAATDRGVPLKEVYAAAAAAHLATNPRR